MRLREMKPTAENFTGFKVCEGVEGGEEGGRRTKRFPRKEKNAPKRRKTPMSRRSTGRKKL